MNINFSSTMNNINTSVHADVASISLTSSISSNSRSISASSSETSLRVPSGRTSKSMMNERKRNYNLNCLSWKNTQAEMTRNNFVYFYERLRACGINNVTIWQTYVWKLISNFLVYVINFKCNIFLLNMSKNVLILCTCFKEVSVFVKQHSTLFPVKFYNFLQLLVTNINTAYSIQKRNGGGAPHFQKV